MGLLVENEGGYRNQTLFVKHFVAFFLKNPKTDDFETFGPFGAEIVLNSKPYFAPIFTRELGTSPESRVHSGLIEG